MGVYYEKLGNLEAALAAYLRAVDLYPQIPPSDRCLMRAIHLLISAGRFDEAIAAGERYEELFPGREGGAADFWIGVSYLKLGEFDQALAHFGSAVIPYATNDPNQGAMLCQIGATLLGAHLYAEARTYLRLVINNPAPELAEWRAEAEYAEASTYFHEGDYQRAVPALQHVAATSKLPGTREVARSLIREVEARLSASR